jgi:hypothetical protein
VVGLWIELRGESEDLILVDPQPPNGTFGHGEIFKISCSHFQIAHFHEFTPNATIAD